MHVKAWKTLMRPSSHSVQTRSAATVQVYPARRRLAVFVQSAIGAVRFQWTRFLPGLGLLLIALMSAVFLIYVTCIASSQFVAQTSFTVRSMQPMTMGSDTAGSGDSTALIVQDTQIILSFLESRGIVEQLDKEIGLRHLYSNKNIDYFSRLASDAKIETFIRYWNSMADTSVQSSNGIVTLSIRAFSPEEAVRIAQACIEASEKIVNQLNKDMLSDNVEVSERERQRAEIKLNHSRQELEKVRNQEAVIDPTKSAATENQLLSDVRGKLLNLEQDYETQSQYVGKETPQIRALQARISAAKQEIDRLTALQTAPKQDAHQPQVLSDSFAKLEAAALESHIAETQYASALSRLENVRLASSAKLMYVETFLPPEPPQQPKYPHRILYGVLLGLLSAGASLGAFFVFRSMQRA